MLTVDPEPSMISVNVTDLGEQNEYCSQNFTLEVLRRDACVCPSLSIVYAVDSFTVPFVTYRFEVQANTGVGSGNFSASQFFETDPAGKLVLFCTSSFSLEVFQIKSS